MEFLKSLWPNSSTNVITIPQHIEGELEDDLDLKVRALTYLFKRLDIENLPAFINDENGIYDLNPVDNTNVEVNEKLDTIYNISEFERILVNDEHRILVDWFKNRFRSICILSDRPTSDYHNLGKTFRFQVLKPDASDEEYLEILIHSDIYIEHSIDPITKAGLLQDIIKQQKSLRPSYKKCFNKNDRAIIILQYVRKLSELVQIDRIFRATLLTKLEHYKVNTLGLIKEDETDSNTSGDHSDLENGVKVFPTTIRSRSRSRSPVRRYSNDNISSRPILSSKPLSPLKLNAQLPPPSSNSSKITPPSSPTKSMYSIQSSPTQRLRSRSSSPVKSLKKKQSMTLLKMDKSLNKPQDSVNSNTTEENYISKDDKTLIYSQSEQAVLFRVDRERKLLRST